VLPDECSDVVRARKVQQVRVSRSNTNFDQSEANSVCRLGAEDQTMLENAIDLLQLSARSMHRILKVARTIADLAGSADMLDPHMAEAMFIGGETASAFTCGVSASWRSPKLPSIGICTTTKTGKQRLGNKDWNTLSHP
jgi:Magnesium chelatase, subunit ChlI C-terminal